MSWQMRDLWQGVQLRQHGLAALLMPMLISGCTSVAPRFDVPTDYRSVPSTKAIVRRIECELVDMVRDDVPHPYEHRETLLFYDYETSMLLNLNVNNTGGLTPSVNFPYGMFAFNAAAELSQSREDSISINLYYSMRDLLKNWRDKRSSADCPGIDTNLAGDLGLRRTISSALETKGLKPKTNVSPKELDETGGEFSGSINFIVTKNLNAVGPTWTLRHFVGPGNLASISEVNNDKLTFGFAEGIRAGTPLTDASFPKSVSLRQKKSSNALTQQIFTDLGTQLSQIRSSFNR